MKAIPIHDAKTNLSKYIAAAKKGEKVYIGGFGKAEVLLVKIPEQKTGKSNKRSFKVGKGRIKTTADSFTDATDKTIAVLMLGE